MTVPPPPPTPPPVRSRRGGPSSHRRRRRLRELLAGRRRAVTVTEPVGRARRWLQRMALPLIALAAILAGLAIWLVYLYINDRLNSLERDRLARTATRDQQQVETRREIDAAAEARTRRLELQLCVAIADVPAERSPRVAQLRRDLRCPANLVPTTAPGATSSPTPVLSNPPPPTPPATSTPAGRSSSSATSSAPPSSSTSSSRPPGITPATSICIPLPGGQLCIP